MGNSQHNPNHIRKGVGEEAEIPEKKELGLMLRNKWRKKIVERGKKRQNNQVRMPRVITNEIEATPVAGKARHGHQHDKVQNT